ncbi:hypothetical protein K4F52_001728 [Lecanicillium sp. MT-2017a]|nr:hypothetical protein K4F52_001728 [Lecanicillium sp. MT-2017a]
MVISMAKLAGLVLGAASCTAGDGSVLEERQLHTLLNKVPLSITATSSPSPSSSSSSSSSFSSPAAITSAPSSTTMQTGPVPWDLTTVFTQPEECSNGITQYAGSLSTLDYWLNIPHPAPGLTLTSCFPPVLLASVTASVDQPPYSQLVCPYRWETADLNSTYRICCPRGFGLYAPALFSASWLPGRPGLSAWCTSWYLASDDENWLVRATPFDGTIPTSVPTNAITSSSSAPKPTGVATKTAAATTTTTASPSPDSSGPRAFGAIPSHRVKLLIALLFCVLFFC